MVAGNINNAVALSGTTQYATLPAGVVFATGDFTMAGWVKLSTVSGWMRVFDFGTGTTNYMFLTPMAGAGGPVRFAITTGSGEQQISGTSPLTPGAWTHVAVTLSGATGILHVNGVEVGRNSAMTLTPASLGPTDAALATSAALPVSVWRNVSGLDYLALQVRRPIGRIGITYFAEASDTLAAGSWTAAVQDGAPIANGDVPRRY